MDFRNIRDRIRERCNDRATCIGLLHQLGIDVNRKFFFRVRIDDNTPSCHINKNGSFHDFGSDDHYGDVVALLYDGFKAFDSLPETMEWLCEQLGIDFNDYYQIKDFK
jgi:hypothetical protein